MRNTRRRIVNCACFLVHQRTAPLDFSYLACRTAILPAYLLARVVPAPAGNSSGIILSHREHGIIDAEEAEESGVYRDFLALTDKKDEFDVLMQLSIRRHHPDLTLTVLHSQDYNLRTFAEARNAKRRTSDDAPLLFTVNADRYSRWDDDDYPMRNYGISGWRGLHRKVRKHSDSDNQLLAEKQSQPIFAKYDYYWGETHYIVYDVTLSSYQQRSSVLSPPSANETPMSFSSKTSALMEAVKNSTMKVDEEIWVYEIGWQKNSDFYKTVKNATWDDVILDPQLKESIKSNVFDFFDSEEEYRRFGIAWRRGVIFHGPPGNGKTLTVKAVMNSLSKREKPIPALYVRNGHEPSSIFAQARELAPCLLVIEDLDSVANDREKSVFLNEIDGLANNNGIFVIGTANNLESLDPSLTKRPSRFDRKFPFREPSPEERTLYAKYWLEEKLKTTPGVKMAAEDIPAIVESCEGFTFAYMQEAFVSTLFALFRSRSDDNVTKVAATPLLGEKSKFLTAFEEQARILRDQMAEKDATTESGPRGGHDSARRPYPPAHLVEPAR